VIVPGTTEQNSEALVPEPSLYVIIIIIISSSSSSSSSSTYFVIGGGGGVGQRKKIRTYTKILEILDN
jgi:hypothetical protein